MRAASLTQLLYSVATSHSERATPAHTPDCVPIARLRSALLRENWTAEEMHHLHGCGLCQQQAVRGQELLYHPSLVQLVEFLRHARADTDLDFHLQHDDCRRCGRLLALLRGGTLLARLGTQSLEAVMPSSEVLPLPPSGSRAADFTIEGERYRAIITGSEKPALRLEAVGGNFEEAAYVAGVGFGEQFVPLFAGGAPPEAASFRVASLPEWGELLVVPAQPLLLAHEARNLWNRFQAQLNVNDLRARREPN